MQVIWSKSYQIGHFKFHQIKLENAILIQISQKITETWVGVKITNHTFRNAGYLIKSYQIGHFKIDQTKLKIPLIVSHPTTPNFYEVWIIHELT